MIFNPKNTTKKEGSFVISEKVKAIAHNCLNKDVIKEFWHNFTFRKSSLEIAECDEFIFSVGSTQKLPLDGSEYSINVDENGICVCAENEKALLSGIMTLLDRFTAVDRDDSMKVEVRCCRISDSAIVKNRMVHFCIFPETELWEIKRFVRFCGALKFTHIVLEFWGMLRYDCMKELSWPHAFAKEDIRPIIREANDLGLRVIPMFNHWGHASAGRVMHGKHVVLDQNPALQTYFSEDGWCWDIRKPKVRELLRRIRHELIELCGDGEYFHIGCDEAYNFEFTKENMDFLCDFINEINDDVQTVGRRAIAWGDMFLYKHEYYSRRNVYCCNAPTPEVEDYMLSHLDKKVIIADWQYDSVEAPVETASAFVKAGFDCLLCPWDRGRAQLNAPLDTVKDQALFGYLHTTWHTLTKGMPYVLAAALSGFESMGEWATSPVCTKTAALLRKVMPSEGNYERSGWSKIQIHQLW